jgi:sporulation protein YlmC with PRC-barrel domain
MMASMGRQQVLDWDGRPVGWVREAVMHPRTGTMRSLLVNLGPEARAALGVSDLTLAIPARQVAVVRRDAVELGVRMPQIARPR